MNIIYRIAVTGGRNYDNKLVVFNTLDDYVSNIKDTILLMHGGCTGADQLAKEWARLRGIHNAEVEALFNYYGPIGGPKRNKMIIDMAPNILIAFPGGKGTANMLKQAQDQGIVTINVTPGEEFTQVPSETVFEFFDSAPKAPDDQA
jgi:hypothetical protein